MKDSRMKPLIQLDDLVSLLVDKVYPEFKKSNISIDWDNINCFATIYWDSNLANVKIKCNRKIKTWHEASLLGLLSHELSHAVQKQSQNSEMASDLEVINRGMGVYLAVERIVAGKYDDYVIKRGKDKYLGYTSIRKRLLEKELEQLDMLLIEMKLIPRKTTTHIVEHHDMHVIRKKDSTFIHVDGYKFTIKEDVKDCDVRIVDKLGLTEIYVGRDLIGQIDKGH